MIGFLDIETIPNESMIVKLPEPNVKVGNLKDPEKIEAKIAEAKQDQINKMALSPLYGRVCAVVLIGTNSSYQSCIKENSDDEEIALLETLFNYIDEEGIKKFITYNGTRFDLPFIYRRAVMLGVPVQPYRLPTLEQITARYNNSFHLDLMPVWCGYGEYETLNNLARALFDECKNEIDFADFPELIKTEEGRKEIIKYCFKDVALTKKTYNRCHGVLFN